MPSSHPVAATEAGVKVKAHLRLPMTQEKGTPHFGDHWTPPSTPIRRGTFHLFLPLLPFRLVLNWIDLFISKGLPALWAPGRRFLVQLTHLRKDRLDLIFILFLYKWFSKSDCADRYRTEERRAKANTGGRPRLSYFKTPLKPIHFHRSLIDTFQTDTLSGRFWGQSNWGTSRHTPLGGTR